MTLSVLSDFRLLPAKLKVPASLVKPLEVGESHIIPLDETGQETLTVSLIDANHCPGAVMFLFEGYFGRILYTGDFRYRPSMVTDTILSSCGQVDKLYLDNTYNNPKCVWPDRSECTAKILDIISQYGAYEIVIGVHKLGKEELLVDMALKLKTRIVITPDRLQTVKILEMPDVFTTDSSQGRIRAIPQHLVTKKNLAKWQEGAPTIAILPTALYTSLDMEPYADHPDIHVVPYSDHSSYSELIDFVSKIKPKSITPVVGASRFDMGNGDMTVFDRYLTKSSEPCNNDVTIPDSVLKYMNSVPRSYLPVNAENCMQGRHRKHLTVRQTLGRCLPKGVIFNNRIDEDLTEESERRKECEQHRNMNNLSPNDKDTLTQSMNLSQNDKDLSCLGDRRCQTSCDPDLDVLEVAPSPDVIAEDVTKDVSSVLQDSKCNERTEMNPPKRAKLDVYSMLLASASRTKSSEENFHNNSMNRLKVDSVVNNDTNSNILKKPACDNHFVKKDDQVIDLTLTTSKQTCNSRSQISGKPSKHKSIPETSCNETGAQNAIHCNSGSVAVSNVNDTSRNFNKSMSGVLKLPCNVIPISKRRKRKLDPAEIFKQFLQK